MLNQESNDLERMIGNLEWNILYDDLLAIVSLCYQIIHILQIRDFGNLVHVCAIEEFYREDDELFLNSNAQALLFFLCFRKFLKSLKSLCIRRRWKPLLEFQVLAYKQKLLALGVDINLSELEFPDDHLLNKSEQSGEDDQISSKRRLQSLPLFTLVNTCIATLMQHSYRLVTSFVV
ncbi:hypothetical protein HN873_001136 [Arachis hypogaea]